MTGVTEKLFMCQKFMCLFRPLYSDSIMARNFHRSWGPEGLAVPPFDNSDSIMARKFHRSWGPEGLAVPPFDYCRNQNFSGSRKMFPGINF